MRQRHALLAAIALTSMFGAASVRAEDRVTFEWSASDPTCLDRASIVGGVEARLGRSVFVDEGADFHVEGRMTGAEGDASVELELVDRSGNSLGVRRLASSAPCTELAASVALVLAVILDMREEHATTIRVAATPAPPRESPTRIAVGAHAVVVHGLVPDWGIGPGAWASITPSPIALFVGIDALLTSEARAGAGSGQFDALRGAIGACVDRAVVASIFAFEPCLALRGGVLRARGTGFDEPRSRVRPLASVSAGVRVAVEIVSSLTIDLGVGVDLQLVRDRFDAPQPDGTTRLAHRADLVTPWLTLGLSMATEE